jgi:hypothetical protein
LEPALLEQELELVVDILSVVVVGILLPSWCCTSNNSLSLS